MRILHLTDRLSARGGAHVYLRGVVAAQVAAGHDVCIAAGKGDEEAPWPCATRLVSGLEARTRSRVALDPLQRALAPDLVHVHTVVNPEALEWAAERGAVVTVQDHRHFCPARGKWTATGEPCTVPLARAACAACFEDAAYFEEMWSLTGARLRALADLHVTVLSHYMRGELLAAGLHPARVHVVPPFVHGLDAGGAPGVRTHVLFAGRLAEAKGVRDALAAWRRAQVGLPLVMAGTGPLRALAEEAGAQVRGWVSRPVLAGLYRGAAAVVMPSRWQEPFGIVGLEALTLGTPVAAWRSGGVAEWHPGGELLAEWGDADGLATALRTAAASGGASPPRGFDAAASMARLHAVYAAAKGGSPPGGCGNL